MSLSLQSRTLSSLGKGWGWWLLGIFLVFVQALTTSPHQDGCTHAGEMPLGSSQGPTGPACALATVAEPRASVWIPRCALTAHPAQNLEPQCAGL